ncbi:MAG TPA: hypothetical protein VFA09_21155, partial [Ktedonobacteraceae bacterium]|nr:hypothetical protein [Ktedonobacteraceae bacterium]
MAASGAGAYQQATYQSSSLLSQTINTYPTTSNACVSGPPSSWNPYDACTIALLSSVTTEFDGNSTSNAPWIEHDYTYDDYNNGLNTNNTYHNLTKEVIKGSNLPSAPPTQLYPLTETWSYTVNNNNGQGAGPTTRSIPSPTARAMMPPATSGCASPPPMMNTRALIIPPLPLAGLYWQGAWGHCHLRRRA